MTRLLLLIPAIALLAPAAVVTGVVKDASGHALASTQVVAKAGEDTLSTRTDDKGFYRLADLHPGNWTLHVTAGALEAEATVTLREGESKTLELTLRPAFFDPPSFIVAGVTDSSNRGGHGSDPVRHSADALSKAAAALGSGDTDTDALAAIRAAQERAEREPTEPHLFDWGAELLSHRAAEQAGEVFSRGHALFLHSSRMLLGLAVSCYARADYDRAAQFFFEATDADPSDPTPYLLLGQARTSPVGKASGYTERMARFLRLHPGNAQAHYYYALESHEEAHLKEAVRIDPTFEDAWLQLGIALAERGDTTGAIEAWTKAPGRPEAHYRLSRAYRAAGDAVRAKRELALYEELSKRAGEEEERERSRIQEFVFKLR